MNLLKGYTKIYETEIREHNKTINAEILAIMRSINNFNDTADLESRKILIKCLNHEIKIIENNIRHDTKLKILDTEKFREKAENTYTLLEIDEFITDHFQNLKSMKWNLTELDKFIYLKEVNIKTISKNKKGF